MSCVQECTLLRSGHHPLNFKSCALKLRHRVLPSRKVSWEVWKLASKVEGDMLKIVLFEVSVVTLMKMNEDGHDFARVHRE